MDADSPRGTPADGFRKRTQEASKPVRSVRELVTAHGDYWWCNATEKSAAHALGMDVAREHNERSRDFTRMEFCEKGIWPRCPSWEQA